MCIELNLLWLKV